MTRQGLVEASNCGGDDTSLLAQQLDGSLASTDSLQMVARVRLAVILSVDKAIRNLSTLVFIVSHIFSTGGCHWSGVTELLRLIERMEELHTEVQGMISYPNLATKILYDVSRRRS